MMPSSQFYWTYDQFERYALFALVAGHFFKDFKKEVFILDIGGVAPDPTGKKQWLPVKKIMGEYLERKLPNILSKVKFKIFIVDLMRCHAADFIQGDGCFLPFKNDSFDLVTSLDTLEHIPPESREQFLSEISRVSRDLIFISFPFQNKEIEFVEEALFHQVKHLYGLEHQQLRQHRSFGLPPSEGVAQVLAREVGAVESFAWGALEKFFFFQSIKNVYLFHPHASQFLPLLDEFIINRLNSSKRHPPYSHSYVLAAKKRENSQLKAGIDFIMNMISQEKVCLKNKSPDKNYLSKVAQINQEITRASHPESVSAVVVAKKGGEVLERCLKALLSQDVFFPLEIAVWDLSDSPEIYYQLNSFFPWVTYIKLKNKKEKERTIYEAWLSVACQVRGSYMLFLDEKVFLPPRSVAHFYEAVRQGGGVKLVCPKVVDDRGQLRVGFFPEKLPPFSRKDLFKILARAMKGPGQGEIWTWSECVLFKRSLLAMLEDIGEKKKLRKRPFSMRYHHLFFWGSAPIIYLSDYKVGWREW